MSDPLRGRGDIVVHKIKVLRPFSISSSIWLYALTSNISLWTNNMILITNTTDSFLIHVWWIDRDGDKREAIVWVWVYEDEEKVHGILILNIDLGLEELDQEDEQKKVKKMRKRQILMLSRSQLEGGFYCSLWLQGYTPIVPLRMLGEMV